MIMVFLTGRSFVASCFITPGKPWHHCDQVSWENLMHSLVFWSITVSYLLIAPSWSFVGDVDDSVDSGGSVGGDGPFMAS